MLFRNLPIERKLLSLTTAAVMLGLLVACSAMWSNDAQTIRRAKTSQILGVGRVLRLASREALLFGDAEAAEVLLAALDSQPSVEYACLRDSSGLVLATYGVPADSLPTRQMHLIETCEFTADNMLAVCIPIGGTDSPDHFGSLTIVSNTHDLDAQFRTYLLIVVGTIATALIVAMLPLALLKRTISDPILALAETVEAITANEDYTVRVRHDATDEIGVMYRAFNRLLERVHQSEKQIFSAQEELIDAKNQAETASRSKSEFLANMSHEIRTPLTGILGFTDLLLTEPNDPRETMREHLQTIRQSGKHLLHLINDILDLSKIEAGQLQVDRVMCNPHLLISEAINLMRANAIEKALNFEYRWTTNVPIYIQSDPARIRQLILNLVGNAIKFTESGSVTVLAAVEYANDVDLQRTLVIEVHDTGIGIAESKLAGVFDPFVQADTSVTRRFGGSGLGLAISKKIAGLLKGDLTVSSIEGRGSCFRLTLDPGDLDDSEMVRAEVADALIAPIAGRSEQQESGSHLGPVEILLVEDGETNRRFAGLVLQRAGARVTTAENGKIGMDLILSRHFDIVFMDMQMPVMDGYSATRALRRAGCTVPIVALTAHAMVGDREKCIACGCTDFLTKPLEQDQLLAAVIRHVPRETRLRAIESAELTNADRRFITSSLPCDEDAEFREIVEEFYDRMLQKLDLMQTALDNGDTQEVTQLAHWLKGSGGTAGFPALIEPADKLEQASRTGGATELGALFQAVLDVAKAIQLPWTTPDHSPDQHVSISRGSDHAPTT